MAVIYAASVKTARMTATRDALANGTIEIGTTGMGTVLATFGLSGTGGTVSGDTWTIALDAGTVNATASGIAAAAQIKTSGGTAVITGLTVTETGGGGDVVFDNTDINSGQNVTLSSVQIVHA